MYLHRYLEDPMVMLHCIFYCYCCRCKKYWFCNGSVIQTQKMNTSSYNMIKTRSCCFGMLII